MPRRGHKKSRAGCADCKRRHVKCDETRPSCVNCKVASLNCSYITAAGGTTLRAALTADTATTVASSTPTFPLTPATSNPEVASQDAAFSAASFTVSNSASTSTSAINLDHLELMYQYATATCQSFTNSDSAAMAFRDTSVALALRFPFLMHAILALSALHLCRTHPSSFQRYHSLASSLQALGLTGLNKTILNIDAENCVAIFLFSTTTGLHSFCDTFTLRDANFGHFLDKLASSMKLMRGVRSVMDGRWHDLRDGDLAELIASGENLNSPAVNNEAETRPLRELLDSTDLSAASSEVYQDSVTKLQRVFNAEARIGNASRTVSMIFAWPVLLDPEYTNCLVQRRPEALIILAFYGVILHGRRDSWAVGDAGRYLISSIADYLGQHYDRWLTWPKAVIAATPPSTTVNTPVSVHPTQ